MTGEQQLPPQQNVNPLPQDLTDTKYFKAINNKKYKEKLTNTELIGASIAEREHYLKDLWKEGLKTKKAKYNVRRAFSNEKSAVYAGISESFKSTLL